MHQSGQPQSRRRHRRSRGHAGPGQAQKASTHTDLSSLADNADFDERDLALYRRLLSRAQERHYTSGRYGPLFLDPADPRCRAFYLAT